jgi:phosphoribosylglycinamide formyltransferase-1
VTARIVVLASGSGTLFQALIDAPQRGTEFVISGLVTDQPAAAAITRAATAGIPAAVIALQDFDSRDEWNHAIADAIETYEPDFVVSAGFMRVLAEPVLSRFANRIINTHPALLPDFPGAHAVRDALAAGAIRTGSTVHFIDAGVDTGPVIAQEAVEVLPDDDEASLHERIKVVERRLLLDVVLDLSHTKGTH